jgi:hypothetical protein
MKTTRFFKVIIASIFSLLLASIFSFQAVAQTGQLQAQGQITNPYGGSPIPFEFTFSPSGGDVSGRINAFNGTASVTMPAGYSQSGGSTFPDCPISGSFEGGDGGRISALATCNGTVNIHIIGPSVDFWMTGTAQYTAQLEGNLYANGTGSGAIAFVGTVTTNAFTMMGQSFPASTSPETAYGTDWTASFSSEDFLAALVTPTVPPTEQPAVPTPTRASQSTSAVGAQTQPTASPIEPTEQAPAATINTPARAAQNPFIPVGGALVGTTTGMLLSLALQNRGRLFVGGLKDGVPSPVNGRMVSRDEANWQNQQIARGNVWDESSGGFYQVPKTEGPSILSREHQDWVDAHRKERGPYQDLIDSLHQEHVQGLRDLIQSSQNHTEWLEKNIAYWDRFSRAGSTIKTTADFSMEVLAKATGPAGQNIKRGYDYINDSIDVYNTYLDEGGAAAFLKGTDAVVGHMGNYIDTDQSKMVSDLYSSGRDYVDLYNDVKDEGFVNGVANFTTKKAAGEISDALKGDGDSNVESYDLKSSILKTGEEQIIDAGVEDGQQLALDTKDLATDKYNNYISGNEGGVQ